MNEDDLRDLETRLNLGRQKGIAPDGRVWGNLGQLVSANQEASTTSEIRITHNLGRVPQVAIPALAASRLLRYRIVESQRRWTDTEVQIEVENPTAFVQEVTFLLM